MERAALADSVCTGEGADEANDVHWRDVPSLGAVIGLALGISSDFRARAADNAGAAGATVPSATTVEAARSTPGTATNATARSRGVGWEQLGKPEYPAYLDRLREAGCPEDKIRYIATADADEWLLRQRIAHAVANDFAWWKSEPALGGGESFGDRYAQLRTQRDGLLKQLLGEAVDPKEGAPVEVPKIGRAHV